MVLVVVAVLLIVVAPTSIVECDLVGLHVSQSSPRAPFLLVVKRQATIKLNYPRLTQVKLSRSSRPVPPPALSAADMLAAAAGVNILNFDYSFDIEVLSAALMEVYVFMASSWFCVDNVYAINPQESFLTRSTLRKLEREERLKQVTSSRVTLHTLFQAVLMSSWLHHFPVGGAATRAGGTAQASARGRYGLFFVSAVGVRQ